MRYALLVCADEKAVLSDQERARRVAAVASFERHVQGRGVLLASVPLQPSETATTVRCWDGGDLEIADAPFAETKEQVAGFYIVECTDLDEAIEVAAKVPAAWYGSIEVRPVSGSSGAAKVAARTAQSGGQPASTQSKGQRRHLEGTSRT